jgi:hypothetical protein
VPLVPPAGVPGATLYTVRRTRRLRVIFYDEHQAQMEAHSMIRATKGFGSFDSFEPFLFLRDIPNACVATEICLISHPNNTRTSHVFVDGLSATPLPRSYFYARRSSGPEDSSRPSDGTTMWPFRSIEAAVHQIKRLPRETSAALFLYPGVYGTEEDRGLRDPYGDLRLSAYGLSGRVKAFRYGRECSLVHQLAPSFAWPCFGTCCVHFLRAWCTGNRHSGLNEAARTMRSS